ncbi:MAG: hypothetical protein H9893_11590 [Candidatus Niameybacter stercoravium]|nr:hypothetical protein [Candidatus Niameybacter stercoravium]
MRKNVSITNKRVLEAYEKAVKEGRGARLIEEAILYYLDSIEKEYITREEVQEMIISCFKGTGSYEPIANRNYLEGTKEILSDIEDVLHL